MDTIPGQWVPTYPSDAVQASILSKEAFYASKFRNIKHPLLERFVNGVASLSLISMIALIVALFGRFFHSPLMAPVAIPACLQWTHLTHLVAHFFFRSSPLVLIASLVVSVVICGIFAGLADRLRPTYSSYLETLFQEHLSRDELVAAGQVLDRLIVRRPCYLHTSEWQLTLAEKYAQRNNPTALGAALDLIPHFEFTKTNRLPLLQDIANRFEQIEEREREALQQIVPIVGLQDLILEYIDPRTHIASYIRLPATLNRQWQGIFFSRLCQEVGRSAASYLTKEGFQDWVPCERLNQEPSKVLRALYMVAAEHEWEQRKKQQREAME